jgi:hypothetical protein
MKLGVAFQAMLAVPPFFAELAAEPPELLPLLLQAAVAAAKVSAAAIVAAERIMRMACLS